MPESLEELYQEARSALKTKNYDHASDLLRQILLVDENYKDTSRLLAKTVRLRRQRWYSHPLIWWGFGLAALLGLVFWLGPFLPSLSAQLVPPIPIATKTLTVTSVPTAVDTLMPSPTLSINALTWNRTAMSQQLPRDTITAIVSDPNDSEVLYVGTGNAGVYKTINGGQSWQPAQNGLDAASIGSLVIDPLNSRIIYASAFGVGVYRSTDGGGEWQRVLLRSLLPFVSYLEINPQQPQMLYFRTGGGLSITQDGGNTWEEFVGSSSPTNFSNLTIDPTNSLNLFAAELDPAGIDCSGWIYTSTNGGISWTKVFCPNNWIGWADAIFISQDGQYLFAHDNNDLYSSRDGGATWGRSAAPAANFSQCAFHPSDRNVFICGTEDGFLTLTTDAGARWQRIDWGNGPIFSVYFTPAGRLLVGGDGLFASDDLGNTWSDLNNGLGSRSAELFTGILGSQELFLEVQPQEDRLNSSIFAIPANGSDIHLIPSEGRDLAIDANGTTIYRQRNQLILSNDDGNTWEWKNFPAQIPTGNTYIFTHPTTSGTVYLLNDLQGMISLFISVDFGVSWTEMPVPAIGKTYVDEIRSLVFGTSGRAYLFPYSLYYNTNTQNWMQCDMQGYVSKAFADVAIDPGADSHLYIATRGNGIYISGNGCESWQLSNTGLGSLFVNTITLDPNQPATLYAGTDSGAYISNDSGQTWNQINDGLLGVTVVYSIVVNRDSNVYASTPYGIFKLEPK